MDLRAIIRELMKERERLDELIQFLESAAQTGYQRPRKTKPGSRRGRKFMGEAERKMVSERMRGYWAARRESAQEPLPTPSPSESMSAVGA